MSTVSANQFLKGGKKIEVIQPASLDSTDSSQVEQNGAVEFGKGVVKGAAESAIGVTRALQGAGQRVIAAVDPTRNLDQVRAETGFKSLQGDQAAQIDEQLKSKNSAQTAGKVTETIGEFLIPFLASEKVVGGISKATSAAKGLTKEVVDAGSKVASKAPGSIAKTILGEADTQIVKSGQNPMVDLFKSGKKRVSDVVGSVEKAISKFENTSKAQLQVVKEAIPDILLHPAQIAERVNQGIMNSIQHSADYKGIRQGFETADDIINSGILKPEESQRLQKVMEFVGKWKDTSARGTLNLKEALSNFYATGENYTGSNAVIRSVQRNLVDLVSETAPKIKVALKKASSNIDKTEEFVQHLFGKDGVTGESKILTLARNLADKAKNGKKLDLIKELEKVSKTKIVPELQGIFDYLQSSKLKAPGLQNPLETVKYAIKKGIEKTVPLK